MNKLVLANIKKNGIKDFSTKVIKAIMWERNNKLSLSPLKKIKYWNKGFKSSSYYIYQFKKNDSSNYVSDVTVGELSNINKEDIKGILNNKVSFEEVATPLVKVPKNIAIITEGKIQPINNLISNNVDALINYCSKRSLVLKPINGNRGRGVVVLSKVKGEIMYNGTPLELSEVIKEISKLDNYLVSELIEQAEYSSNIFPYSTNTIRLLILKNTKDNLEPFIAVAVHRFGTVETIPADNWSRGGLSSAINLETGEIGPGVRHPKNTNGNLQFYNNHPDTNKVIAGVYVPFWTQIKESAIKLTKELNIRYVGWDILVTDEGFYFIEGNSNSDLDLLQVHQPLLKNEKVKRFLKNYNYIS